MARSSCAPGMGRATVLCRLQVKACAFSASFSVWTTMGKFSPYNSASTSDESQHACCSRRSFSIMPALCAAKPWVLSLGQFKNCWSARGLDPVPSIKKPCRSRSHRLWSAYALPHLCPAKWEQCYTSKMLTALNLKRFSNKA